MELFIMEFKDFIKTLDQEIKKFYEIKNLNGLKSCGQRAYLSHCETLKTEFLVWNKKTNDFITSATKARQDKIKTVTPILGPDYTDFIIKFNDGTTKKIRSKKVKDILENILQINESEQGFWTYFAYIFCGENNYFSALIISDSVLRSINE